jgi:undecaprenyl-diphosphatase
MRARLLPIFLTILLAIPAVLRGEDAAETILQAPQPPGDVVTRSEARRALSHFDAFVLGIVEGITEYLPVSSTGHLILANAVLGLTDERPVVDDGTGAILWLKAPNPEGTGGTPMTIAGAADTYAVVIQSGAIAAVILVFWPYMMKMLMGVLGRDPQGLRLLTNIMIAVIPAAVLGLVLRSWIKHTLFSVPTVIAALMIGSVIMLSVDNWQRRRRASGGGVLPEGPELWDMNFKQSLTVGIAQCVAMWPGMSRSMMAIVGGYIAGLSPRRAAEFSFLVGLPTLTGAALLESYKEGPAMIGVFGWNPVLFGFVVSAVAAALAVKWLVGFLQRRGLAVFAYYRIGLAIVVTVALLQGWI